MLNLHKVVQGLSISTLMLCFVGTAFAAEKYPTRPIEVVVTFGPGGGADAMGRKMSRLMEQTLGVPLPVSNISGASGNSGLTKLLTNPADGYTTATLIALSVSSWATGLGTAKPQDLTVIAVTQDFPSMLFVHKNSPFNNFQEFLDFAQNNPNRLKVATSGYGTQDDITLKYLATQGYITNNVPFAKPSERYASPLGRHTDAIYEEPGDVAQLLIAGQLRPLVVFAEERHPSFPDTPTSKEFGMDINDLPNFRTFVVPAATPPDRVKLLAEAIDTALDTPEWKEFCAATYTCTKKYTQQEAQQHVENFYNKIKTYTEQFK